MAGKESVRDAVFDLVGVRDKIGVIDNDCLLELVHAGHIAIFDCGLDEVFPLSVALLELWSGNLHRVIKEATTKRLSADVRVKRMGIEPVSYTHLTLPTSD